MPTSAPACTPAPPAAQALGSRVLRRSADSKTSRPAPHLNARQVFGIPSTSTSSAASVPHATHSDRPMRGQPGQRAHKPKRRFKRGKASSDDPNLQEVEALLGHEAVEQRRVKGLDFAAVHAHGEILHVKVEVLTTTGIGLARDPVHADWAIMVHKSVPGDELAVRVTANAEMRTEAVIEQVLIPSPMRTETPRCKHFHSCSGCQYQMLAYPTQLDVKRRVVDHAFVAYSGLNSALIPPAGPTLPSPRQYGYRTKISPHFDLPGDVANWRRDEARHAKIACQPIDTHNPMVPPPQHTEGLNTFPIGFNGDDGRLVDVDRCPLATDAINRALPLERQRVRDNIHHYRAGATLLLRDSLVATPSDVRSAAEPDTLGSQVVTDMKHGVVYEHVGATWFQGPANDFFQNNRAILQPFLEYVREEIVRWRAAQPATERAKPAYLIDAYCGSGLFALTLAPMFARVAGIEISGKAVKCAVANAVANDAQNVSFTLGSAEALFTVPRLRTFDPQTTTVVLDPPRRGSDQRFLDQLIQLAPKLIIYVSCNVNTQARDVGYILAHAPQYSIFSLRGADFFPQTQYVSLATRLHGDGTDRTRQPRRGRVHLASSITIHHMRIARCRPLLTRPEVRHSTRHAIAASVSACLRILCAQQAHAVPALVTGDASCITHHESCMHHASCISTRLAAVPRVQISEAQTFTPIELSCRKPEGSCGFSLLRQLSYLAGLSHIPPRSCLQSVRGAFYQKSKVCRHRGQWWGHVHEPQAWPKRCKGKQRAGGRAATMIHGQTINHTKSGLAGPWLIWTLMALRPSGPFPEAVVSKALMASSNENL